MDPFQALVLGALQGITEWLPVSSEGQTMLAMMNWLDMRPSDALSCSIFLHTGTMLAVIVRFRREFIDMLNMESKLMRTVIVATLFTGVTGVPLYMLFRESFKGGDQATLLIGGLLIITGLMLRLRGSSTRDREDITTKDMAILGLAQGFSILPGVSRSGTTLTVLLMRGVKQDEALLISFIISVPAVLGAIALDCLTGSLSIQSLPGAAMLTSSFITGYATMDVLMRFARNISFSWFCISMGMITLALTVM
ncbi:MAG: undecaprenyl-diphosphate phosphatase [Methanothrix sp.]|nr:undecaprenyl-diphosphate phosphatase [Methanothrix sp.]MCX8207853.1 undecaprenyl-diphosphate phosphatase [Methanothrix sp.]